MSIGERIKNLRKSKGYSQEELAKLINTTDKTISKWENNRLEPNITSLTLMSNIFNISIDYLVNGTNYKNSNYEYLNVFLKSAQEFIKNSNNYSMAYREIENYASQIVPIVSKSPIWEIGAKFILIGTIIYLIDNNTNVNHEFMKDFVESSNSDTYKRMIKSATPLANCFLVFANSHPQTLECYITLLKDAIKNI